MSDQIYVWPLFHDNLSNCMPKQFPSFIYFTSDSRSFLRRLSFLELDLIYSRFSTGVGPSRFNFELGHD